MAKLQVQPIDAPLTAALVYDRLSQSSFVRTVVVLPSIDSTNSFARHLLSKRMGDVLPSHISANGKVIQPAHSAELLAQIPCLVLADEQSSGRGRLGRQWIAEKGTNLLFSLLIRPHIDPSFIGVLPLCVGESVAAAVQSKVLIDVETKWPNDLLMRGRKVCGILIESVWKGQRLDAVIVGIGVNVNQRTFSSELEATSLALETGRDIDRLALLADILDRLRWLESDGFMNVREKILQNWRDRTNIVGKKISVASAGRTVTGFAKGISEKGELLLEVDGAIQTISAGDATIVKPNRETR